MPLFCRCFAFLDLGFLFPVVFFIFLFPVGSLFWSFCSDFSYSDPRNKRF